MATTVNKDADIRPTLSPKFKSPIARPPSITVKLSQDKKVRSFAKKTLGSTRVGRAIRFPLEIVRDKDLVIGVVLLPTRSCLKKWLT